MDYSEGLEEIILDACCLINLIASGHVTEILGELPARFIVSRYVGDREALYVLAESDDDPTEPIDLKPLVSSGLIRIVDLVTDQEAGTYVDLTAQLEDGEAMTCALAVHNDYTVATDERKVLNRIRRSFPRLRVRTTAELIRWWSDLTRPSDDVVKRLLGDVQRRARFAPSRQDSAYEWWNQRNRGE